LSTPKRFALATLAVVAAAIAFVLVRPEDEEPATERPPATAGESPARPSPAEEPGPRPTRVEIRGGEPVGGVREIAVKRGETVRLTVTSSDSTDDVHVHGYDLLKALRPGRPARFRFRATIEGGFEIELEGTQVRIATLVVEPS
jgi:FtsP/CotA-like multicopper oxidase with cupredoxin domain